MKKQIVILSTDEIFARMLELEFQLRHFSVQVLKNTDTEFEAEVVLLDLDSLSAPNSVKYRQMIGFTRTSALSGVDSKRQCSMILHRPFEMQVLCREISDILEQSIAGSQSATALSQASFHSQATEAVTLQIKDDSLLCGEQSISLSRRELQIFTLLLERRGQVVAREDISAVIGESSANKVDVYICYLRRKLEKACSHRLIATVRGQGYQIL